MNIIYMAPGDITPYGQNAKKHPEEQVEHIANSIKEFGFRQPLVIDKDGVLIIGHGRLLAAKKLGLETVPVVKADDLTEEQVKALRLADNKTNESDWDFGLLDAELDEIIDIDMTDFGFELEPEPEEVVEDEIPEEVETRCKPGDVWELGGHRLVCGDSTDSRTFETLMRDEHADMVVTSPPYGVGKDYEEAGIGPWFDTMKRVIKNITEYADVVVWNLGDMFPTGTQFIEPTNYYSCQMFMDEGFKPIWIRIWKKQGMNFGISPYHLVTNKPVQQYEYISAFGKDVPIDADEFNDDQFVWLSAYANHQHRFVKRLSREEAKQWGYAGIWDIKTVKANKDHPAMFPVELPWRCIKLHSDKGGIVLEPFCGSGTTIIACEQTGRICRAVERDPKYCDLTIQRWENFTGQKAHRI